MERLAINKVSPEQIAFAAQRFRRRGTVTGASGSEPVVNVGHGPTMIECDAVQIVWHSSLGQKTYHRQKQDLHRLEQ